MQTRLLSEEGGLNTFAVILETGDEAMACLQEFAEVEGITAARFSAIGAFSDAVLAYFEWETRGYRQISVGEQVEVASLNGDVAVAPDGKPTIHVHVVLGRRDGTALAGHLAKAHVRPTLEVILTELPAHLQKRHDPESGLVLIAPSARPAQAD